MQSTYFMAAALSVMAPSSSAAAIDQTGTSSNAHDTAYSRVINAVILRYVRLAPGGKCLIGTLQRRSDRLLSVLSSAPPRGSEIRRVASRLRDRRPAPSPSPSIDIGALRASGLVAQPGTTEDCNTASAGLSLQEPLMFQRYAFVPVSVVTPCTGMTFYALLQRNSSDWTIVDVYMYQTPSAPCYQGARLSYRDSVGPFVILKDIDEYFLYPR